MACVYHQLFCDESGKYQDHPLVAFSGVSVTPDRLAAFDAHWQSLLRSYELPALHMARLSRLPEDCGYRFRKGQTVEDRTALLIPFADCINKHLERGFIQTWSVQGYNKLSLEAKRALGGSRDPYFLAFVRGLVEIVETIDDDDRISIIVDDDANTAWDCYMHYREIGKSVPDIQKKAVAISFANDRHFPALQAADMVAFLARQEAAEQFYGTPNIWRVLFDRLITESEAAYGVMRWLTMFAGEDQLVRLANEMNIELQRVKNEKSKRGVSTESIGEMS